MSKKFHAAQQVYSLLSMLFVACLLTANVLGAKPLKFGELIIPAGLTIFPLTYLIGALLTEVYGFKKSRQVIWVALGCNLFLAAACQVAIAMPYDRVWQGQQAYQQLLGASSRLMLISVVTYFIGEYTNAWIIAKLRKFLNGRYFMVRALCGNWIGEFLETVLFITLAFVELPCQSKITMISSYLIFKWGYAGLAMPLIAYLIKGLQQLDYQVVDSKP